MYCIPKKEPKKAGDPEDICCEPQNTACMYGGYMNPSDRICSTLDAKFFNLHKD